MQPYEGQMEGYPVALWGNVSCFQEAQSSSYDSCCVNGHLQLYHSSVSICRRSCEPISCRRPSLWHCCKDSQPLRTKSHSCLHGCTEAKWLEFLRIFRLARGCIHCMGRFDMLPMASELLSRTSEGFEAQRPQCAAGQAVAAFSVLIASAVAFSLNSRLPVHAYAFEAQYCFRVSFGLGFKCLFHFAPVYGLVTSGTVYGASFVTISIPVQRIGWFYNESIAVGHMPWRPRQSYWHRLHHAACHRWIGGIFAESQMFRCSMCLHRWNRCHSFSLPLFAVIGLGRLSLLLTCFILPLANVSALNFQKETLGLDWQIGFSPFVISACRKFVWKVSFHPENSSVIDVGSGGLGDSLYFLARKMRVLAVDARHRSEEVKKIPRSLHNKTIKQIVDEYVSFIEFTHLIDPNHIKCIWCGDVHLKIWDASISTEALCPWTLDETTSTKSFAAANQRCHCNLGQSTGTRLLGSVGVPNMGFIQLYQTVCPVVVHWWFARGILKSSEILHSGWWITSISTLTGCWHRKSLLGALNPDLNPGMVKDWWVLSTLHWFLVSCMNWRRWWFHLWLAQRSWQAGTMQWRIAFEASERLFYLILHRVFKCRFVGLLLVFAKHVRYPYTCWGTWRWMWKVLTLGASPPLRRFYKIIIITVPSSFP